ALPVPAHPSGPSRTFGSPCANTNVNPSPSRRSTGRESAYFPRDLNIFTSFCALDGGRKSEPNDTHRSRAGQALICPVGGGLLLPAPAERIRDVLDQVGLSLALRTQTPAGRHERRAEPRVLLHEPGSKLRAFRGAVRIDRHASNLRVLSRALRRRQRQCGKL